MDKEQDSSPAGSRLKPFKEWVRAHRVLLAMTAGLIALMWLPFYGNLFPPLVDLPEHLLVSKLLWETLVGTSTLDLQLTSFLGYKLFPYVSLLFIGLFKLFGISLIYLPKAISVALIALFSSIVAAIGVAELEDRQWRSAGIAACIILPAAVGMYVACWFIGFVNYTLGITFIIPAIYFTDRFIVDAKLRSAILIFTCLLLAYLAHPFVPVFWLMWCFGRGLASLVLWRLPKEWIRLLLLGATFAPIAIYHIVATAGSPLAPATDIMTKESPFLPFSEWMKNRFWPLIDGMYLKADDVADGSLFAIFAILFILFAVFVSFWFKRGDSSRGLVLAGVFATITASVVNEKFIPVPAGHWLAYDYRFASSIYAICLVTAAIVIIRHLPDMLANARFRVVCGALAFIALVASLGHLVEVRAAYSRFDTSARPYMAKVLNGESPAGLTLPHSRWHPDGTLIKLYVCMVQPDCNLPGTTFYHGYSGDLYPVKYGSKRPQTTAQSDVAPIASRGTLAKPRGIAADSTGNYYVADTGNGRVQAFDPDGKFISAFGEGQLKEPNGIAVAANGDIYVTDVQDNKLFRFDRDGKFVKDWSGPAPGFYGPRDVATGPGRSLFIIDQGNGRIVRFDTTTEKFSEWGSLGDGEGQFREATGIATADGLVLVADNGNGRIQVFDVEGNFIRRWDVPDWQRFVWHYPDLAYDESRKLLYVTSGTTKQVMAFDLKGNRSDPGTLAGLSSLANPSSLTIALANKQSRLLVLDTGNSTVTRFPLSSK
ncbi:MAG: hypothetical protein KBD94_09415 [Pyrinomonadaceae bacterium]|nr:hypothetical protein [Pyrinomonadaceae bacterium]